jgi:hypothetical protein
MIEHTAIVLNSPFLVVFDEIHKYARWKNSLKGIYDQYKDEFRFLVTGSGRHGVRTRSVSISSVTKKNERWILSYQTGENLCV